MIDNSYPLLHHPILLPLQPDTHSKHSQAPFLFYFESIHNVSYNAPFHRVSKYNVIQ